MLLSDGSRVPFGGRRRPVLSGKPLSPGVRELVAQREAQRKAA